MGHDDGRGQRSADKGAEGETGGHRNGSGQRRPRAVLSGMELPDGGGHARHHHSRPDPVDDLAREQPGHPSGQREGDGAEDRGGDPGHEQRTAAETVGHRSQQHQRRQQDQDVDAEEQRDRPRAEAVAILVDREERGREVAAHEEQHLGGDHEPEARAQRPAFSADECHDEIPPRAEWSRDRPLARLQDTGEVLAGGWTGDEKLPAWSHVRSPTATPPSPKA